MDQTYFWLGFFIGMSGTLTALMSLSVMIGRKK